MNIRVSFAINIITSMALFLIVGQSLFAQDQRQQNLEAQRKRLQQEIKQINTLLFSNLSCLLFYIVYSIVFFLYHLHWVYQMMIL